MAFFGFGKGPRPKSEQRAFQRRYAGEGLHLELTQPLKDPTPEALLDSLQGAAADDSVLGAYIAQLASEESCFIRATGAVIPWSSVYALLNSEEHRGAVQLLALPSVCTLRPILGCEGTLSSPDFDLSISGWTDGTLEYHPERVDGAVITANGVEQLMPVAAWETVAALEQFRQRPPEQRTQHQNELTWGTIRQHADAAGALYTSRYLETTYVLTPQSLRLPVTRQDTAFGRVFTVAPTFQGAPDGWLKAFDGFDSVQPHYDLTRRGGLIRVVISEPVRKVLQVIKREMPGRRVSGSRAEKFLHNPWAFLGDAAHEVINEEDFTRDRSQAGPVAVVFSIVPRIEDGRIDSVDLCVTEHFGDGSARTDTRALTGPPQLEEFIAALKDGLEQDRERFPWEEYDLTIDADSALQLERAQQLVYLWREQPAERIAFDDVYALEEYSERIEGIGVAKPIYVPVLQKPTTQGDDKDGWLPSDLTPMVRVTLQGAEGQVLIPLTKQWVEEFDKQVQEAENAGNPEVHNTTLPTPIATSQARKLADSFRTMLGAQARIKTDTAREPKEKKQARETLLVKTNFHGVDYHEERRLALALPSNKGPSLPKCLRQAVELKEHQLHGIAWFQHLVSLAPTECRGALLADDMGLGKTLQLLCVLASHYESNSDAAPSAIIAPKSLLENWANEAAKFFTPAFPRILVLYGEVLREKKQPLGLIDRELQTRGIVELLKPNWVGDAKIVVTTYEILTNFEFSFAKQPFAFVICDEAQRIKTPGTLVTLAAKKLKADFRVACTGTPVENSLADLWCLFDFVQPGLLGALEHFGKTYRRPIECETAQHKESLDRLQTTIAPQTLRRTKADIASLLPKKYFAAKAADERALRFKEVLASDERLEIVMSEHQRTLYKAGLKKLQDASKEINGRKRAQLSFGALHLMKAVCAEPYCLPGTKFLIDKDGRDAHLSNSPKLQWLLARLTELQTTGEKAIVFTELREVQAALYYFLRETFGLKPFVINGDSQGRQAYIDKFSAKSGFDVIILSTLAAGAGLNITAANHVFHFTRAWNPAKESQATDRAYRIGQQRDVYVYCPTVVTDFATFEVRLDQLLRKKAGLAGSMLDASALGQMLNGTGPDVTLGELVGDGEGGAVIPKRYLTLDDVDRMDGFSFEVFCCLLWKRRGFQALLTPKRGGDGGIDVVAFNGRDGELLQCKSSINGEVGWDAIKEVTAGAARYQAQYASTRFRRVAVTNQAFTKGAVFQAEANQVDLVTRYRLEEFLGAHPITNHEFDEELVAWLPQS